MPTRDLALPLDRTESAPERQRRAETTPTKLDEILALQRSVGNAAVARMLAREPDDDPDPDAGSAEETLSGEIEDLEGEEIVTSCEHQDEAYVPCRLDSTLAFEARSGPSAGASASRGRPDSVASTVNFGSLITEGGAAPGAGEFGLEKVKYKADNTKWTKAASTVSLETRMFLDIGWGVHALGRTDVPGPNDGIVTKTTWTEIRDDLKPDGSGRPTRAKYWAKDLTEKHEKFHASDDIGRARLYLPTAKAYLDAQTVNGASAATIETDVKTHVEKARSDIEADGWAYYDAGSGAGENRAYADGKSSYQGRVDAISARAVTEKW